MQTYEFTLVVSGLDPTSPDFETRIYDAGGDAAAVAYQGGRVLVDFSREAESLEAAIAEASEVVVRAGGHVEAVEQS